MANISITSMGSKLFKYGKAFGEASPRKQLVGNFYRCKGLVKSLKVASISGFSVTYFFSLTNLHILLLRSFKLNPMKIVEVVGHLLMQRKHS
jgi:hypothetical protein